MKRPFDGTWTLDNTSLFLLGFDEQLYLERTQIYEVDLKAGWVELYGYLPACRHLYEIGNGARINVINGWGGFYVDSLVIMRFSNCRISDKRLGPFPNRGYALGLTLRLDCDIEVVFDEATKGEGDEATD